MAPPSRPVYDITPMGTRLGDTGLPSDFRLVNHDGYCPDPSLAAFGASSIGVAILDRKLHFCAINRKLAGFNRFPPEAHLGKPLDPFIGKLSAVVGSRIERVFMTETPIVGYEVSGKLPKRDDPGFWIEDYLPIFDRRGRIAQVCTLVVEVTHEETLKQELADLRGQAGRGLITRMRQTQRALGQLARLGNLKGAHQLDLHQALRSLRKLLNASRRLLSETIEATCEGRQPIRSDVLSVVALPDRQRTVIQLLAQGRSPKEIASLLDLSPKTVENHKARIFRKLGFESLADLVRYAIKNRLVKL